MQMGVNQMLEKVLEWVQKEDGLGIEQIKKIFAPSVKEHFNFGFWAVIEIDI